MPKTERTAIGAPLAAIYKKFPSLPDGIYIGLDEARYHADTALGSSNIRDLLKGANLFWHKSFLNPKKKADKDTPSKVLGRATHKLLLEGTTAFTQIYIRGPYSDDDDLSPAEKSALTKAAKNKLLEGQQLLKSDDFDFVMGCKEVLDTDPELKGCLDNALTEVSVFWTRADGVRCKVRFDALKLRGIGDIKTIANERERDMEVACKLDIHTYRYDIPAMHYTNGRWQMKDLLAAGKVFVQVSENEEVDYVRIKREPNMVTKENDVALKILDFLERCVAQREFGFQLVFIPKKGAPDAWSCTLTPGNPIMTGASQDIETAISYFLMALEKYGLEQRWIPNRLVEELDINTMPYGFGRVGQRSS